ncbi:hypothetical protein CANINC_003803 [Pichia inconspicua]|uniref:Uncharacterized protein n=1 Tax=Pichia inconspicua TaxID=52247 RepID=A0A4T0WXZ2_9ASCO|nr:hypothetical protein CANINC_003803 [[Candida] inconspicua]
MSLRKKKSSLSLSRQSTVSAGDLHSNFSDDYGSDKDSNRIEKKLKRMSLLFHHRSKTEELDNTRDSKLLKHTPSINSFKGDPISEIPPPNPVNPNNAQGFYYLRNNSSGTLVRPSLDLQSTLGTNINNVEFNNVRSNSYHHEDLDSFSKPPGSAKSIESKLGRFFSKTGNKVKKLSDLATDNSNSGLGLQTSSNINGLHGWSNLLHHSHNNSEKELKSPIGRGFPKSVESKLGFGEKLKLLNSTKYKTSNYHNLLRNKKEKGIKLGSKVNELMGVASAENYRIAGTSIALNDFNYRDIDTMCDNQTLTYEQCDQYANFLISRIQQLSVSIFKGEGLSVPMEDLTKLVSMYVRIRKCQEKVIKSSSKEMKKYGNVNDCTTILENDSMDDLNRIKHSASQNSLKSLTIEEFHPFETPYMKSNGFNGYSPVSVDIGSPSMISPMINMRGISYSAFNKTLEEIKDVLKVNMNIMVNQLYYDKNNDRIKFIRGSHNLLSRRKNTIGSVGKPRGDEDGQDMNISYGESSISFPDSYSNANGDFPTTTRSFMELPIATHTETRNSVLTGFNSLDEIKDQNTSGIFESFGDHYDSINDNTEQLGRISTNTRLSTQLGLGLLPIGRFERCVNVLWDIFQTDIMYEIISIMLPLELEFANGHREASRKHRLAEAILYNHGEKIRTFTNTNIHPDISGTLPLGYTVNQTMEGTLGEWTDINIRNLLLIAYRDNVVIPLYELNREYEDVRIGSIEDYADVYGSIECFQSLAKVSTGDTNQKLVENLLAKFQDAMKCPLVWMPVANAVAKGNGANTAAATDALS